MWLWHTALKRIYYRGGERVRAVKENAYAKINLFLDVVGKRPDGFHDVDTVMHSIALFDTLTVTLSPARVSTVSLRVIGNDRLVTDD